MSDNDISWGLLGQIVQLRVEIVKILDDAWPVWVEAHITDLHGKRWRLQDKWPIFSAEQEVKVPSEGWVRGTVLAEDHHPHAGPIFLVTTDQPDQVGYGSKGCATLLGTFRPHRPCRLHETSLGACRRVKHAKNPVLRNQ